LIFSPENKIREADEIGRLFRRSTEFGYFGRRVVWPVL